MSKKRKAKPPITNLNDLYQDKDKDELKFDTELLKMQIGAETGNMPVISEDTPIELQHFFLNNVMNFEKQFSEANEEAIGVLLGKKKFKDAATLNTQQLNFEFDKLFDLLGRHNISVTWLPGTRKRTIYKFIVEELIHLKVQKIDMPGMMRIFPYEEFHPNHKHDCMENAIMFLQSLLKLDLKIAEYLIHDELIFNNISYDKKIFLQKALLFKEAYDSISDLEFTDMKVVSAKKKNIRVMLEATCTATFNSLKVNFGGESFFDFVPDEENYFLIQRVKINGINL